MRFAFIATEKACYPVALMCRVLKVSRAGYYAWYKRPASQHTQEDQRLGLAVAAIYREKSRPLRQPPGPCRVARARPAHRAQAGGAADADCRTARARTPSLPLHH